MRPRGLFLVTGPTGSGKSTSLASMINYINENFDHHIITIEDPIEFYHYHKKSTINQREIGVDVPSFSEAIRRALRQDPDVILVGEMRDLETIEAAITAAETGPHRVRHAAHHSAQGTVNRIIDVFPTNQQDQIRTQLSTSIIGILSQALCPRSAAAASPPTKCWSSHRHRQPDSRKQDLPHHLGDSNRCQVRHAAAGRLPVQPLEGTRSDAKRTFWPRPNPRTSWPPHRQRRARHLRRRRRRSRKAKSTRDQTKRREMTKARIRTSNEANDDPKYHRIRISNVCHCASSFDICEIAHCATSPRVNIERTPWQSAASVKSSSIWASSPTSSSRCCSKSSSSVPAQLLGKIGRKHGLLNEEQLAQALAEQMGMQVIELADTVIPHQVLSLSPSRWPRCIGSFRSAFEDNTLTIATCDPAEHHDSGRAADVPGLRHSRRGGHRAR